MNLDDFGILVYDDAMDAATVAAALAVWPGRGARDWNLFNSALEQSWKHSNWVSIPEPCRKLLTSLMLTYHGNGLADLTLYDAGLCQLTKGQAVQLQLPTDQHPVYSLHRMSTAILVVQTPPTHQPSLAVASGSDSAMIPLLPNRLITFPCSDTLYWGLPTPLACGDAEALRYLVAHFWGWPSGPRKRKKATWWTGQPEV